MRRIRTKLVLSLLVVTLIPLVPSYHLVRSLVDRSFELGFNETVETAIEGASTLSRQLYARLRAESLALTAPLAASPHVLQLLTDGAGAAARARAEAGLRDGAAPLGRYAIDVYDVAGTRVAAIRALPDSLLTAGGRTTEAAVERIFGDGDLGAQMAEEAFALLSRAEGGVPIEAYAGRLDELAQRSEPTLLEAGNDPAYVSVFLPVDVDGQRRGSLLVARRTPDVFLSHARQVQVVNQVFKTLDYHREDLRRLFIGVFLFFYLALAALAVGVGYIFSRRLTSPLLRPVQGTRQVAGGDLDYRIEVSSQDEIGQLMASFNQMIAAIKEGQQLAQEREQARQRAAAESAQHERDLEVSRLQTRALQAENERKNIELKKGEELERAYGELEESHRQLQEAQAQLILQEKMASLGTMVAGFAHEINNPMGAVHSAADVANRCVSRLERVLGTDADPEEVRTVRILRDNLRVVGDAEARITGLVQSLRNFGRLDEAEMQMADLHEGLDSSLHLLGQLLGAHTNVRREYGEIPRTFCSVAQINQVFMSVLRNAAQAIEGEGEIVIRTQLQGDRIAVSIRDTGTGIPPEQLKRIFDLHFSANTSRVKLGSGLSMAYRIVQEHKGDLRIDSVPGQGTEATILLPVREVASAGPSTHQSHDTEPEGA